MKAIVLDFEATDTSEDAQATEIAVMDVICLCFAKKHLDCKKKLVNLREKDLIAREIGLNNQKKLLNGNFCTGDLIFKCR